MQLLTGDRLFEAITKVVKGNTVSCAVAFWGRGAETLIGDQDGHKTRLICNLKMGGTNPDVIESLMKSRIEMRQNDRVHAKVYIGNDYAIVTSANASINGLGLEGQEQASWIEAGIEVPAAEVQPWFDELWNASRPILRQDIEDACRIFRERLHLKPTRGSFADFHPTKDNFPLHCWVEIGDYVYNDAEIKRSLGYVNNTVYEQIDYGFDIEAPEEVALFTRGRWFLHWQPKADGRPSRRSTMWWHCSSGTYVPNAFTYEGELPQGCVLGMHPMPPKPFNESEPRFRHAFAEVMSRPKFAPLCKQEYQGSFYTTERQELMWQFWLDLKPHYNELSA